MALVNRFVLSVVTAVVAVGAVTVAPRVPAAEAARNVEWSVYRGNPGAGQFAELAQINAANVHQLEAVWHYRTGDASQRSTMHANPIVVQGIMYVTTPSMKAVALDARTGREADPLVWQGRVH
jgi:quinoprotein glucose dehydrogenase